MREEPDFSQSMTKQPRKQTTNETVKTTSKQQNTQSGVFLFLTSVRVSGVAVTAWRRKQGPLFS
jgi:hypothetical protein